MFTIRSGSANGRLEQHRVGDAEDGGVGADAQRDCQGAIAVTAGAARMAKGVTNVEQ
jgi:hypothetical protein